MRTRKSAEEMIKQAKKHMESARFVPFNLEKLGSEEVNLSQLDLIQVSIQIDELLDRLEKQRNLPDAAKPEDILYALVNQSGNFPFNHQLAIIETALKHPFLQHLPHLAQLR